MVAIKCIQKRSLSKTATENLLTEIELLKKLDHEHIVKLKDFEVSVDVVKSSLVVLQTLLHLQQTLFSSTRLNLLFVSFPSSGVINIFS